MLISSIFPFMIGLMHFFTAPKSLQYLEITSMSDGVVMDNLN
ncbi:hypothetical protein ESCOCK373M_24810 [Escherichia coli]